MYCLHKLHSVHSKLTSFPRYAVQRAVQLLEDVEVLCAKDETGRPVAIKLARQKNSDLNESLLKEATVLQKLSGLGAPTLLDSGVEDGNAFLILDWINGIPVDRAADALRQQVASYPWNGLLDIAIQLTLAYSRFHSVGVLHGDVHPRNALVGNDGSITVLDFGLAHLLGENEKNKRGGSLILSLSMLLGA